jgi:glycosyltransferase involved in cell wall biosynthesis
MKILWLSHVLPYPPKGGFWQRSYNLLKEIGKRNEVHLISLNKKKLLSTSKAIDEAKNELKKICNRIDIFPIKSDKSKSHWAAMTILSYFKKSPYDFNWLYNKDMLSFVNKLAKTEKYDLIHLDTLGVFPYALPFAPTPFVLNHHNIESNMMLLRYEKETMFLKKWYFKREAQKIKNYERKICNICALNLVVSDLDALRLKNTVGNVNIAIVPNGVDLEYFQPSATNEKENNKGLIFAGGMGYYANREAVLYFLSEIWPLLREDDPNRPVTIIGRNPPKELLDATCNSNLFAPGFVDDVRPFFDAAKIYICPIKNGGGTRLKIIDALAMKKPLVATGLAVEGLDLVEGEHYLRAEKPTEFIENIKRLENDSNLCKKLSFAGRKFVENRYSWDLIGRNMEEAYWKVALDKNPLYIGKDPYETHS